MSEIDDLGYSLLIQLDLYFWLIQIFTFIAGYRSPNVRFIILITIFYRLSGDLLPPVFDYLHIFSYLLVAIINLAVIYSISRRKKVAALLSEMTIKIVFISSFFMESSEKYRRTTSELPVMMIYFITALYFCFAFIEASAFISVRYIFGIEIPTFINDAFYIFHFVINSFESIIFLALSIDGIKNFYGDNTITKKFKF